MRRRHFRALVAVAPALLWSDQAQAHAFSASAGTYDLFVEGAAVALTAPPILLPLLALGLLAGQRQEDGMLAAWPAFMAGIGAGILLVPFVGPGIAMAALAAGVASAATSAAFRVAPSPLLIVLGLATGAAVMALCLEGHVLADVPFAAGAGLVFGVNLAMVASAGLATATLQQWPREWIAIGWRVVASWVGATSLLYLAFLFRGQAG